jgi:FAD/FMN-containing dehydrogenase
LVDIWRTAPPTPFLRSIELAPWGGAYNDRASGDTAIPHRDTFFSILFSAIPTSDRPDEAALAQAWVDEARSATADHATGALYQNFRDADLAPWDGAYFAGNAETLRAVKRRYDPDDLFPCAGAPIL